MRNRPNPQALHGYAAIGDVDLPVLGHEPDEWRPARGHILLSVITGILTGHAGLNPAAVLRIARTDRRHGLAAAAGIAIVATVFWLVLAGVAAAVLWARGEHQLAAVFAVATVAGVGLRATASRLLTRAMRGQGRR